MKKKDFNYIDPNYCCDSLILWSITFNTLVLSIS